VIGLLLFAVLAAEQPEKLSPATDVQLRFFEAKVRPVLVEHCQKCHGPKKQWAGLRVDSREALLRGGDSGPAVVPGDSRRSLLMRAVRHDDQELKMPVDGKLSEQRIADLAEWIDAGALFPAKTLAGTRSRDPKHWSFQPLNAPPLPQVNNRQWAHSSLDNFVLEKIESAGVAPAAPADQRTLIRRVTFDLTGLPPTPDEVASFVTDEEPDAYERLIDRLLASPASGERWGRHWLDVARYADSNGLDENIAHGHAWRYRDYIVAAFNHDKPFDRLIVEQLAGDLLPAENDSRRHELLIATGFLSIGPKVLAEVNEAKMRMDMIDEQVDTVGRVFLGMTFGCARCHDHKFDPIDATDYYALAGIFKSTRTMQTYTKVAKWNEHLLPSATATAMQAEYDQLLAQRKQAVEAFVAQADKQARELVPAGTKPPEKLDTLYPEATKTQLAKLREELSTVEKNPPDLPAAMGVTEDKVTDVAIQIRGNPLKLGEVVSRRVPSVMRGPSNPSFSADESGRRQLADWLIDPRHPLTARVAVNRVWRWHFGKGLVRSTDNFGLLGEAPSHPELLDWLARRFIADGWSFKQLHRLILTSSTFRQSSLPTAQTVATDPDNRLVSRMMVRRLDAEEVRDSLLAVGQQLDRAMGGSLLKVKNRAYLFDHTSIDLTDYTSQRRSLYLPVIRNNLFDLFQLLDFPDPAVPSGDRAMTTVAPQALLMLNSDFAMKSASEFANRLFEDATTPNERLTRMYAIAFGREPTVAERQADGNLLFDVELAMQGKEADADVRTRRAWSVLCQIVLAANEFIYVH